MSGIQPANFVTFLPSLAELNTQTYIFEIIFLSKVSLTFQSYFLCVQYFSNKLLLQFLPTLCLEKPPHNYSSRLNFLAPMHHSKGCGGLEQIKTIDRFSCVFRRGQRFRIGKCKEPVKEGTKMHTKETSGAAEIFQHWG